MADINSAFRPVRLVSYGEAMLRYAPVNQELHSVYRGRPSAFSIIQRTVGGDELNVCIDRAVLDGGNPTPCEWVSVLPGAAGNKLADVVRHCALDAGVSLEHVVSVDAHADQSVGAFSVLPEDKTVIYQRCQSAFARAGANLFDWRRIYGARKGVWLHATGITPLLSASAKATWVEHIEVAQRLGVPVSLDLNHRAQLGTLAELWAIVSPLVSRIRVLILSRASAGGLARLLRATPCPPEEGEEGGGGAWAPDDARWAALLVAVQRQLGGPVVACCFKSPAPRAGSPASRQTRWSVCADAEGAVTTRATPVVHCPKDQLGGGSAWAAGLLDALFEAGAQIAAATAAVAAASAFSGGASQRRAAGDDDGEEDDDAAAAAPESRRLGGGARKSWRRAASKVRASARLGGGGAEDGVRSMRSSSKRTKEEAAASTRERRRSSALLSGGSGGGDKESAGLRRSSTFRRESSAMMAVSRLSRRRDRKSKHGAGL